MSAADYTTMRQYLAMTPGSVQAIYGDAAAAYRIGAANVDKWLARASFTAQSPLEAVLETAALMAAAESTAAVCGSPRWPHRRQGMADRLAYAERLLWHPDTSVEAIGRSFTTGTAEVL